MIKMNSRKWVLLVTLAGALILLTQCDWNKLKDDWDLLYYTVTYDANDGTGVPPSEEPVKRGNWITLPDDNGLKKAGSTFGGWNTQKNGNGENYEPGDAFQVTRNIIFYAKWD